jgi:hypothetical protein
VSKSETTCRPRYLCRLAQHLAPGFGTSLSQTDCWHELMLNYPSWRRRGGGRHLALGTSFGCASELCTGGRILQAAFWYSRATARRNSGHEHEPPT